MPPPWMRRWLVVLGCLMAATTASAASLQISPVTINLAPGERATTLQLQNTGLEPIYGQVRVFAWRQENGDDVLEPTDLLVVSPPLLQIAPRAAQMVRLLQAKDLPANEKSFRLLIDEIPPPGQLPRMGVDLRLRYSVPVFTGTSPSEPVTANLRWSIVKHDGETLLQLENTGSHRAQVSQVVLEKGGKQYRYDQGLLGYALAGSTRRWGMPFKLPAGPGAVQVNAIVNTVPTRAPVSVAPGM